jgi:hypothetical protein
MAEDFIEMERDEVALVLEVLQGLLRKVANPVVRACLEEAHDDIAYLGDQGPGDDGQHEPLAA